MTPCDLPPSKARLLAAVRDLDRLIDEVFPLNSTTRPAWHEFRRHALAAVAESIDVRPTDPTTDRG